MATKTNTANGENRIIEAKIKRSLRIFIAAALVIALVIPLAESALTISSTGQSVMRFIDAISLITMLFAFTRAFLLDRKLSRQVSRA